MKRVKPIILLLMLSFLWNLNLRAEDGSPSNKKSISGELIVLLDKDDGVMGAGLDFQYRFVPQVGFGLDIIMGMDGDGAAYTVVLPNMSYHFLTSSQTLDLFTGVGVALVLNKPSFVNSDFATTLYGFAGAKVNVSRLLGSTLRVFVGPRGIGGGSLGLTFSFK